MARGGGAIPAVPGGYAASAPTSPFLFALHALDHRLPQRVDELHVLKRRPLRPDMLQTVLKTSTGTWITIRTSRSRQTRTTP